MQGGSKNFKFQIWHFPLTWYSEVAVPPTIANT